MHVETEETKPSISQKNQLSHVDAFEDFCDLLFDMTVVVKSVQKKGVNEQQGTNLQKDNWGTQITNWFKEEELMRKKLEKGAINQLKNRIAQ